MAQFQYTRERVIVALDTTSPQDIRDIIEDFSGKVWGIKIGLEVITAFGAPKLIKLIRQISPTIKIFFDQKFHDIPNTIAGATKALAPLEVDLFNIHASAGIEGIKAAVQAKAGFLMKLLGVTVLTSHTNEECNSIFGADSATKVKQFAEWLAAFGGDGVVCSAHEATAIKKDRLTHKLLTVVPGIRLPGDAVGDQARVMTPAKAIEAGADLLVMGRSLTNPADGNRLGALVRTEDNIETLASR